MSGRHQISPFPGLLAILFVALCYTAVQAAPAEVSRSPGETDAQFVKRVTGQEIVKNGYGDKAAPQLARTTSFIEGAKALVAFTEAPEQDDTPATPDKDIVANIFVAKSGSTYARLDPVVACETEGGEATLRAFFYVDVGNPASPRLGVICGWDQTHAGADCSASDEVRLFKIDGDALDDIDMKPYASLLYKQVKPSKDADYTCTQSKFKSARDVKALFASKR